MRVRVRLRLRVNPNPHPNQVLGEAEQLQVPQRVKLLAHKLAISPYISIYLPDQVLQRVNVLAHKLERASAYLSLHRYLVVVRGTYLLTD